MQFNRNIIQPEGAQPYREGEESYASVGDLFGKAVGFTEGTVKTLAKATADNLVIPVGTYVATKIVVPVGEHVATEIVLPVGKYVAKEVALPIAKEVSAEIRDLTTELMKSLTEQIKQAVKQEIDVMQDKIKEMPSKIMEGIKSSIKLPFGAPTMDIPDEDCNLYTYNLNYGLEI
jgi:hypothetical protein